MNQVDPILARRGWWLCLTWVATGVVVWLSLTPSLPAVGVSHADKLGHFLAYGCLGFGFASLYRTSRHAAIVVALITLGLVLEFVQSVSATRFASGADAVANALGAGCGVWLVRAGGGALLPRVERWFGRGRQRRT